MAASTAGPTLRCLAELSSCVTPSKELELSSDATSEKLPLALELELRLPTTAMAHSCSSATASRFLSR